MIGLIVTGHGKFGTGLTTSVELVAGPQQNYVAVDFDGQVSVAMPNVRVIAGTNLPMLMATCLMRGFMDDIDTLANSVMDEARNGIMLWQMPTASNEPAEGEEGI